MVKRAISEVIHALLRRHPELRDNPTRLCATVWKMEIGGFDKMKLMTSYEMVKKVVAGELASPESVIKISYAIQKVDPSCRGPNFMDEDYQSFLLRDISEFQKLIINSCVQD